MVEAQEVVARNESAPAPAVARTTPPPRPRRWRRAGRVGRWALVAVLLVAASLGAWKLLGARGPAPVRYETVAVDRGAIAAKVTANGTLSALVTVLVGSQVSGRIETLKVDFNSPVKRGQVVATLEPSLFRAAVEQARANLVAAQANVDKADAQRVDAESKLARAQALYAANLASRADLETAQANVGVARAQVAAARSSVAQAHAAVDQAELNLRYATITSPIDGVVISRNVDVGQTVAAAFQAPTLFTIAQDLGKMQVDTSVAEADVGKVRPGMAVTFTVDAYPTRTFPGVVRQVRDAATTVQNVVTYDAVIDVDNEDHALKPGMTATVTFVYAEKDDVLRVPNAALRFHPDAPTVAAMASVAAKPGAPPPVAPPQPTRADEHVIWVLRGGAAVGVLVRVGIADATAAEIVAGDLRPGDRAITEATPNAAGKRG